MLYLFVSLVLIVCFLYNFKICKHFTCFWPMYGSTQLLVHCPKNNPYLSIKTEPDTAGADAAVYCMCNILYTVCEKAGNIALH